jgi:arylsulfatase A-like enzyme
MLVPHWYHQIRADLWNIRLNMCSAGETNHILTTWFDRHRDDSRPFFCFVNYAEAHDPYLPPPAIATQYLPDDVSFAEAQAYCQAAFIRHGKQVSSSVPITPEGLEIMQAMYDAELRYQDDRLGELLTALDERGLLDDTIIVAVGDHGEHFGEHGLIGHENSLYEPLLHVPMLVVYPGHVPAGVRDQRLAQTTDVLPTTLALCGIEAPVLAPQLQGSALFTDVETAGANTAIAEFALTTEDAKRMMREGSWKLIDAAAEPDELYDLEADPDETRNIYAEESGRATRLAADLDQFSQSSLAMTEEGDQIELGEEALRMLRSLGYVGD